MGKERRNFRSGSPKLPLALGGSRNCTLKLTFEKLILGQDWDFFRCRPSRVDMLGVRYKLVHFGAGNSPGSPDWWAQIDYDRAKWCVWEGSAAEQDGNESNGFQESHQKHGSSQGLNLALTVVYGPTSLVL